MNTLPFSELVEINPRVKIEKAKEYLFVEMGIVEPGRRYVRADQNRIFQGGGAKFLPGDTLFARITPCLENGKIAQYQSGGERAGFGSTEFFVFRARPRVSDPGFVYYLAKSDLIRKPAEKSMSGASGRQRADIKSLVDLEVPFPLLATQRKIAAILSAYDDLIENNLRRIKILEGMAQNLYREWFVKFRFPGHQHARFVDSSLGRIPEGWEVVSLDELAVALTKGTTPTTFGKEFKIEGINFFKVESIDQEGGIEESKLAKIDSDTHELLKRSQLRAGDILFSIAGAIGRTTIVPKRVLPANTNQALAIIRIPDENSRTYIFYCVRADEFQHFSLGRVVQTAQANVSLGILKSAPIVMPPKGLLVEFVAVASSLLQMQENIRSKNIILRRTRDLLLPKLISGEVDVSELEIAVPEEAPC
jgi:type I restriction enzyme S subunit